MLNTKQAEAVNTMLKEKIASGEKASLIVATDSMRPMIAPGDRVLVRNIGRKEPAIGDILLYEREQMLCVHRLVSKLPPQPRRLPFWQPTRLRRSKFITKGDASLQIDRPLSMDQLLGKVAAIDKRLYKIDLQRPYWQVINKLIAIFSLLEAVLIKVIRRGVNAIN